MKKLACAAMLAVTMLATTVASAAAPTLAPHVYGVKITGAAVPAFNATWLLGLKQTSFQLARNNAVVVSGTAKITGNKVTFHDVSGPLACTGAQASGTYAWRLRGTKLTLTRVSDSCAGRRTILAVVFVRIR